MALTNAVAQSVLTLNKQPEDCDITFTLSGQEIPILAFKSDGSIWIKGQLIQDTAGDHALIAKAFREFVVNACYPGFVDKIPKFRQFNEDSEQFKDLIKIMENM